MVIIKYRSAANLFVVHMNQPPQVSRLSLQFICLKTKQCRPSCTRTVSESHSESWDLLHPIQLKYMSHVLAESADRVSRSEASMQQPDNEATPSHAVLQM